MKFERLKNPSMLYGELQNGGATVNTTTTFAHKILCLISSFEI